MTTTGTVSLDELIANSQTVSGNILGSKPRKQDDPLPDEPPDARVLMLETALYLPVPYARERDAKWLERLRFGAVSFDAYCPYCKDRTTWRTLGDTATAEVETLRSTQVGKPWAEQQAKKLALAPGQFARHLICQRNGHLLTYVFLLGVWAIVKIGQYPSIADVASSDIEKFRKMLGDDDFGELHRAGGLFAHKVGIGSFVYLRRIFERLIRNTWERVDPDGTKFPDFITTRMDDKIELLKDELPPQVVRNRATYKILSKGVHELSDDECLLYFPLVRSAVVLMLERQYEADERRKAEKKVEDEIAALAGKLGHDPNDDDPPTSTDAIGSA